MRALAVLCATTVALTLQVVDAGQLSLDSSGASLDRVKKEIEHLETMDGTIVTGEILAVIQQMRSILADQVMGTITGGIASDQLVLDSHRSNVLQCETDLSSMSQTSAEFLKERKVKKAESEACVKTVQDKTNEYFAAARILVESFKLKAGVCCKRDAEFSKALQFPVGQGAVLCDFTRESAEVCTKRALDATTAAKYNAMNKGRQYEEENKNCKFQEDKLSGDISVDAGKYASLGTVVKSCSETTADYNEADTRYANLLIQNCKNYEDCRKQSEVSYATEKGKIKAREANAVAQLALANELACMMDAFVKAGKVDLSLTTSCKGHQGTTAFIRYDPIPAKVTCEVHLLEILVAPPLVDRLTSEIPESCEEATTEHQPISFAQKPACPGWCQPISAPPTTTTPFPTTSPPTPSPTMSLQEKIAQLTLEAKRRAEEATKQAIENAKKAVASMTSFRFFG